MSVNIPYMEHVGKNSTKPNFLDYFWSQTFPLRNKKHHAWKKSWDTPAGWGSRELMRSTFMEGHWQDYPGEQGIWSETFSHLEDGPPLKIRG